MTYPMTVAGLRRDLPICKVTDDLYIGAFIVFGDAELTVACARELLKLVPAEVVGGVKMLKALGGPYGNMKFMPTGGISAQNAAEYLALPNVLCCGGSWMVPGGLLDAGDFDAIEALAREAAQIVKK